MKMQDETKRMIGLIFNLLFTIAFVLLIMCSCGKDGEDPCPLKELENKWEKTGNSADYMEFKNDSELVKTVKFGFFHKSCKCDYFFIDSAETEIELKNCRPEYPFPAPCSTLNKIYDFKKYNCSVQIKEKEQSSWSVYY